MTTTDTITIRFKNALSDHLHASRVYEKTTFFHKIDKLVAVLLFLFGCWSVYAVGVRWWTVLWFVLAPFEWFNLLSLRPVQVWVLFKRNPKFLEWYELTFSEEGMLWKTDTIDARLRWTHYNKVVESNRAFLLIYGKWAYSMIPKSAFSNEGQVNAFRDLLRRKVGSYVQVRRPL